MSKTQTAFVGISSTLVTQGVSLGLTVVFSVIFTRILGPEGRGALAVFTAAAALVTAIVALGFPTANAYFVAQDGRSLPKLFSNSLLLGAGLVGVVLLVLGLRPDIQRIWGVAPEHFSLGLGFFVLAVPLSLLSQLLRDLLLGKKWFVEYNLATASITFGYGVLGLILIAVLQDKLLAVVLAYAFSMAVPVLMVVWWLRAEIVWDFSWPMLKRSATLGLRPYVVTLITSALMRLSVFMISRWLGSGPTGLYSAASNLAYITATLPIAAVPVVFTFTASDQRQGIQLALKTNRLIFVLVLIANLLMAVFSRPLLMMFGPEFASASTALRLIAPGMLAYSVYLTLGSYFQGLGYPLPTLAITLSGLVVNFGLNLWLIPSLGINGAAVALTLSYSVMAALGVVYTLKTAPGVTLQDFFWPSLSELRSYAEYLRGLLGRLLGKPRLPIDQDEPSEGRGA